MDKKAIKLSKSFPIKGVFEISSWKSGYLIRDTFVHLFFHSFIVNVLMSRCLLYTSIVWCTSPRVWWALSSRYSTWNTLAASQNTTRKSERTWARGIWRVWLYYICKSDIDLSILALHRILLSSPCNYEQRSTDNCRI